MSQTTENRQHNVPIKLACGLYDRMQPLYTGAVKPQGIDLQFEVCDFPRKLFDSAMAGSDFDVCEMSSCDFITRTIAGDCPFVALPVFPSKAFRHGMIAVNRKAGIRTPKDLEGKRVGVMRYTMSAAVWIRGHLQNDYGVDLSKIHWVEGSVNDVGSHGVPTIVPPGVSLEVNQSGRPLSDLIDAGEIDAVLGTHLPNSRFHNPDVTRLFADFKQVEQDYYRATGIFPIMHLIAIRKEVYDANPFIAQSLFDAFNASKAAALERMKNFSALRYMLPWMTQELDEIRDIFGDDPWLYGLEENRKTLETLVQFLVQQGMMPRSLPVDQLFVPVK